jgi:hypothetical protein
MLTNGAREDKIQSDNASLRRTVIILRALIDAQQPSVELLHRALREAPEGDDNRLRAYMQRLIELEGDWL